MATKTTNYNLAKPSYSENADISVINSNMDIIDSKMKEIENKAGTGGGGSNVEWNQIQTTGSKIAEVTIDGTTTEVYAPSESGGGGGSSEMQTVSGTFTSPATSQGTVHVDCGFKPDIVSAFMPINGKNTCSYFNKFIRTDGAYWDLRPFEGNSYFNSFGDTTGETGICGVDETGFTFRSNGYNTHNVECSYIAYKI